MLSTASVPTIVAVRRAAIRSILYWPPSINPLLATFDQSVIGHLLDPLPSANGYRQ
jgi:hypothetical protein